MSIDKKKYRRIPARMVSLAAMFAAFTLVTLYLSAVLPNLKFVFYFLSSVFITGILIEGMPGMAAAVYICVSGLALIIMPIYYALPYVILFGHYGIGKYFIETRVKSMLAAFAVKLIYFDVALAGVYFAVIYTGLLPMGELFSKLPVWAFALIAQPVFLAFDFIYSKAVVLYINTVRNRIVRGS